MTKEIIAADIFCGAGGLTRGLIDSGINVVKGYDIESALKKTYEENNKPAAFYQADITTLTGEQLLSGVDRKNKFFLLAGCAPCQPFSGINKQKTKSDSRRNLVLEFARLVNETQPDYILLENVPGLKNGFGKTIFKKFVETLEKNSYFYDSGVRDAKKYGIPQTRRRLILIASKHNPVKIPAETHGKNMKPFKTVKETIKHFPRLIAGNSYPGIPNHQCSKISKLNLIRLKHIPKNGGSRADLPKELQLECHKNQRGYTDTYSRMRWNSVSPTLTCKCTSISNGRFAHPTQTRGISLREAAALQTFKDRYEFYGNYSQNTAWIGNAVPVDFARVFGDYFVKQNS